MAAGTMYSGSSAARLARSRAGSMRSPANGDTYATSRAPPAPWLATTTASRTCGSASNCAAISPSSMRKPRIFTWWSMRPR
ncbi:hypothetical protein D9M68_614370 [compost metagenome]